MFPPPAGCARKDDPQSDIAVVAGFGSILYRVVHFHRNGCTERYRDFLVVRQHVPGGSVVLYLADGVLANTQAFDQDFTLESVLKVWS